MSGNAFDIGELVRRLGWKGTEHTLPIAPVIVPTLTLLPTDDLVATPKKAHGWAGVHVQVPAATRYEFQLAIRRPARIKRLSMCSTRNDTLWGIGRRTAAPALGGGVDTELGQLTTDGEVIAAVSVHASNPCGVGQRVILQPLDWFQGSDETFYVTTEAIAALQQIVVGFEFVQLPSGVIEP